MLFQSTCGKSVSRLTSNPLCCQRQLNHYITPKSINNQELNNRSPQKKGKKGTTWNRLRNGYRIITSHTASQNGAILFINDGFCVSGLQVTSDFYLDPNARTKIAIFERYMRQKRTYDCKCHKYNAGWLYRVLSTTDAAKLEEHEKRVSEAAKAFWQAEHARRTQATA